MTAWLWLAIGATVAVIAAIVIAVVLVRQDLEGPS
jgi:heme exporter protein D